jgi:hypothetical protein
MASSYRIDISLTTFTALGLIAFALILTLGDRMGMDRKTILISSTTILAVTFIVPIIALVFLN